jgi:predicted AAA+ superfamily ATPase
LNPSQGQSSAAQSYGKRIDTLNYWRSSSGFEVDLLINQETAVEFKSGGIHPADAKGILALGEDLTLKNRWIVGREERPRTIGGGIEVLPWQEYLARLESL